MAANSPQNFPRDARLTAAEAFKRVFRRPVVSADDCFKVLARCNGLERSRLGMAVSRQVDRCSPGRNRIKRVIRESFRRYAGHLTTTACHPARDYVVLPRRGAASICNSELTRSLDGHWSRVDRKLSTNNLTGRPAEPRPVVTEPMELKK
jgi:ribonuclease P protein component